MENIKYASFVFIHITSVVKTLHIFIARKRVSASRSLTELCFHPFLHFAMFSYCCKFSILDAYGRSSRTEMFCKKGVLGNFAEFTGKRLCLSLLFDKVTDLRPLTLLKKRYWHGCFPVKFAKFLRTPFPTEHLRWLFLLRESWVRLCPGLLSC